MSLLINQAEHALALCLQSMYEVLESCIEDAMPQTSLHICVDKQKLEVEESNRVASMLYTKEESEEEQEQREEEHQQYVLHLGNPTQISVKSEHEEKQEEHTAKLMERTPVLHGNISTEWEKRKELKEEYVSEQHEQHHEEEEEQEEKEENEIPDTLRQRLEWEMAQEEERVGMLWTQLHWRIGELRSCLVQLGGGSVIAGDNTQKVIDIPVEVLDRDITRLSNENAKLAHQMIELYAEADSIADRLTQKIMAIRVDDI